MGAAEIEAFLTYLAVEGKVAASIQNQALSAILFLYREVLETELPWLDKLVRAKRPQRLPSRPVQQCRQQTVDAAHLLQRMVARCYLRGAVSR
jgi:hypothetical protein